MTQALAQPLYSSLAADPDMADLVEMFVEEMPDRIANLLRSLESADWASLGRTAHQLKGAAGSYGFHQLTPYSARLEESCKQGEPEEAIRQECEQLLGMCRALRAGTGQ